LAQTRGATAITFATDPLTQTQLITVDGVSRLNNLSTSLPALQVNATSVDMVFSTVTSANTSLEGANYDGTTTGFFTVNDAFTIDGTTGLDGLPSVTNSTVDGGTVTVQVP
jgi:hypothetical protein